MLPRQPGDWKGLRFSLSTPSIVCLFHQKRKSEKEEDRRRGEKHENLFPRQKKERNAKAFNLNRRKSNGIARKSLIKRRIIVDGTFSTSAKRREQF